MTQELKCNTCTHKNVCNQAAECICEEYASINSMEEIIKALELGKPAFDGEDTNYDVATIENAITIIEKYVKIKKIVDEFHRKVTKEKPIETPIELQMYLKEYEAHERCLANQLLDIFDEVD